MSDSIAGLESAAAIILKRAVTADTEKKFLEALTCYKEGIDILLSVSRACGDEVKRGKLRTRIEEYINRAEKLKILIEREKQAGRYHEQIKIEANSRQHSYARIFQPLMDEELTHIDVEDPFIRSHHQLLNFLRFCEMLVKSAGSLKSIVVTTGQDEGSSERQQQTNAFNDMAKSLLERGISLQVTYSSSLHDREIRFNNGWVVKIGRGLDYFKPVPKFSLGYCDLDLRPCHETTVDIFHRKNLKPS